MSAKKSALHINGLQLQVYLGWPDQERLKMQTVFLSLIIQFANPPKACETDHLEDTICYSTLVEFIQEKINSKKFHLIEHLCFEIYHLIKPLLSASSSLSLSITKYPDLPALEGGVQFYFGENEAS